MTPNQLADQLDINPKALRRWLRSVLPAPGKGGRWDLTSEQVALAREHFAGRGKSATSAVTRIVGEPELPSVDVETLADWSSWVPFTTALAAEVPRLPGVYMARQKNVGVVYVGRAGKRRDKGLMGRLGVYLTGKAAVSGLGEAAMDRALADADWLRDRLADLERNGPMRTKEWARLAVERADLQVRWATTADRDDAIRLEREVLTALRAEALWNRLR